MAQVESAVVASEMKSPSRWQTAQALAVVHLWPPAVRLCTSCTLTQCSAEQGTGNLLEAAGYGLPGCPSSCAMSACWGNPETSGHASITAVWYIVALTCDDIGHLFFWCADMNKGPRETWDIAPTRSCTTLLMSHRTDVQDASGLRGASSLVAAGEDAALTAVTYQLGYAIKDVGVDFQVNCSPRLAKRF